MQNKITRFFSILLSFCLIFQQSAFAQIVGELNISGYLSQMRGQIFFDTFRPVHLRYLSYDNQSNNFKLLLDKGDAGKDLKAARAQGVKPQALSKEFNDQTKELLKYFFIGLTLPNEAFWVNLRPDSPENIIDPELAQTDIGRILLEADLQLKKDTANYTSPRTPEGKKYWDKLYKKAGEFFGSENISIPTLTRPWIVPGEVIIRETKYEGPGTMPSAYIYKATLKVMLEADYLKQGKDMGRGREYAFQDQRLKILNEYSTQLINELIIPKLNHEINSSKKYASLRQVYYSLIFAQWFKSRFFSASLRTAAGREAILNRINSRNLSGLTSKDPWSKTTYFQAYQKSFKDGEYNLKEPIYTFSGQSIRSYFSGGIAMMGIGSSPAIQGQRNMEQVLAGNPNMIEEIVEASALFYLPAEGTNAGASSPSVKSSVAENADLDDRVIKLLSALAEKKLEYGLMGGSLSNKSAPVYRALRKLFIEHDFNETVSDTIAQTLSRMKEGSLETMYLAGVITEKEKDILAAKQVDGLDNLSEPEKTAFCSRLHNLIASYEESDLTDKQNELMLKRLIPLLFVDVVAKKNEITRASVLNIMKMHPDFFGWISEAKIKVDEIASKVNGLHNAWFIVIAQSDVDSWLEKAEAKVKEIAPRVGGSRNAWFIVIAQSDVDSWLEKAEAKVKEIAPRVGGRANAWSIVIRHVDVGTWLEKAEAKVKEIAPRVGGSRNAWFIVIAQSDVDSWLEKAEAKVKEIAPRVGGSRNAWRIIIRQKLEKVDDWVEQAEKEVDRLVVSGSFTKTKARERVFTKNWVQVERVDGQFEGALADIKSVPPASSPLNKQGQPKAQVLSDRAAARESEGPSSYRSRIINAFSGAGFDFVTGEPGKIVVVPYERESVENDLASCNDLEAVLAYLDKKISDLGILKKQMEDEAFSRRGYLGLVNYNTISSLVSALTGIKSSVQNTREGLNEASSPSSEQSQQKFFSKVSQQYIQQARSLLRGNSDDNIIGLLIYGSTAKGTATKDSDLDYLLIKRSAYSRIIAEPADQQLQRQIETTLDFVLHGPGAILLLDSPLDYTRYASLDEVIKQYFVLPGGVLFVEAEPRAVGVPFISDWLVVAKSDQLEADLSALIRERIDVIGSFESKASSPAGAQFSKNTKTAPIVLNNKGAASPIELKKATKKYIEELIWLALARMQIILNEEQDNIGWGSLKKINAELRGAIDPFKDKKKLFKRLENIEQLKVDLRSIYWDIGNNFRGQAERIISLFNSLVDVSYSNRIDEGSKEFIKKKTKYWLRYVCSDIDTLIKENLQGLRGLEETISILNNNGIGLDLSESDKGSVSSPVKYSLEYYKADIRAAYQRGEISFAFEPVDLDGVGKDDYSHIKSGVTGANTRVFSKTGKRILKTILMQNVHRATKVLVLGPGLGAEAAQMYRLALESKRAIEIDTVSLAPVAPRFLWLPETISDWEAVFLKNRQNNSLNAVIDLQEKGEKVFELLDKPFIHQQYIGELLDGNITLESKYDFVYDNFGSFSYSIIDNREEAIRKTLFSLAAGGIFYCNNVSLYSGELPGGFAGYRSSFYPDFLVIRKPGTSRHVHIVDDMDATVNKIILELTSSPGRLPARSGGDKGAESLAARQTSNPVDGIPDFVLEEADVEAPRPQLSDESRVGMKNDFKSSPDILWTQGASICFVPVVISMDGRGGLICSMGHFAAAGKEFNDFLQQIKVEGAHYRVYLFGGAARNVDGLAQQNQVKEKIIQDFIDKGIINNESDYVDRLGETGQVLAWIAADAQKNKINYKYISSSYSGSSPVEKQAIQDKGGIDFRAMPTVVQPMLKNIGIASLERLAITKAGTAPSLKLEKEWIEIQKILNAGITPSNQRIKEYLLACCQNAVLDREVDKVLGCIASIMRREEERASSANAELREILVLVESSKTAIELQQGLNNIACSRQEPKKDAS